MAAVVVAKNSSSTAGLGIDGGKDRIRALITSEFVNNFFSHIADQEERHRLDLMSFYIVFIGSNHWRGEAR